MRVQSNKAKKEVAPKSKGKIESGTIHHVHILDSSGSMSGGKYNNAIEGINLDIRSIQESRKDFPELTETMTIVEFDNQIKTHIFMEKVETVSKRTGNIFGGTTALYQAIGETIEKILKAKQLEDKVVLKIFTDGGENASTGIYRDTNTAKELIKKVEKNDNFTVTFVGTKGDVENVVRAININVTNTLVHDNTAGGVQAAFCTTSMATTNYRKAVLEGEDVTQDFYGKSI